MATKSQDATRTKAGLTNRAPGISLPGAADSANVAYWVREVKPAEYRELGAPHTGDRLPDGCVILLEEDIDRMGLAEFRRWIVQKIVRESVPVAVCPVRRRLQHTFTQ